MKRRKSANDIFLEQQAESTSEPLTEQYADEDYYDNFKQENSPQIIMPVEQKIEDLSNAMPSAVTGVKSITSETNKEFKKKEEIKQMGKYVPKAIFKTSEDLQLEKEPIKVKTTGILFKKVIVPPNVYVVHTRFGKKEPVTLGLGMSFNFNPKKDSYLIVPAAMQTIGVVANCITKEKQGINVLAYVQWQIEDFSVAYKKLDFSDSKDPLAITNAQLREQAEAAIKDKIATMSVEEVLTDKAPIIEELTNRLKAVAEGESDGVGNKQEGLGIKIITVQIREAIVSSTTLWEYLQAHFRNEEKKKASISAIEMENEIQKKELETKKEKETREAEINMEIEQIKQKKETEMIELKYKEEIIRYKKEQDALQYRQKLEEEAKIIKMESEKRIKEKEQEIRIKNYEIEKELNKKETELKISSQKNLEELEKLKIEAQLLKEKLQNEHENLIMETKNNLQLKYKEELLKIIKLKQEINNMLSTNVILNELVEKLPEIASKMPQVKELKIFQSNNGDPLIDNLINFIQKFIELISSIKLNNITETEIKK